MSKKFKTTNENYVEFTENEINEDFSFSGDKTKLALLKEEENQYYKLLKTEQVEEFKKSQKPKKKLVNKIIAWALGAAVFAGAVVGAGFLIKDKIPKTDDYNLAIQTKFEQVDEILCNKLGLDSAYEVLENRKITSIEFLDPTEEDCDLKIYYEGLRTVDNSEVTSYAIFNVLIDYYNKLVTAEETGNMLYYLDALNEVFKYMDYVEAPTPIAEIPLTLPKVTEENINVFNEIFNINNVNNPEIVRQVGFLPYHIKVIQNDYDKEKHKFIYTYEISGISYCETKSESTCEIDDNDKLIIASNYNKNKIKAYNRVMTFTSYTQNSDGLDVYARLKGDIYKVIDGVNNPYTVETTYFKEVNLFEAYKNMMKGNFNFEKPEDFNLKEYISEQNKQKNNLY